MDLEVGQSDAVLLRDEAYNRVRKIDGIKTLQKAPILQFNSDGLPMVGLYIARDQGSALGDAVVGQPRFRCILTLGIAVVTKAVPAEGEHIADKLLSRIMQALLNDATFRKQFDGVTGYSRVNQFPAQGETFFAQVRCDLSIQYETDYPPLIVDDFEVIHFETDLETRPVGNTGVATPIHRQYDVPQV